MVQDVGDVTGARSVAARITTPRFGQFHAGSGRVRERLSSQSVQYAGGGGEG